MIDLFLKNTHPQWHPILKIALAQVDVDYLVALQQQQNWLPGIDRILAAFSLPLDKVKYVLMGESPYPRQNSANGYAFWDNAVNKLWNHTGLHKEVNRATSLRNWIKMLLFARGDLSADFSQTAIAKVDKSKLCQTAYDLFNSFIDKGFLLLNASLVYEENAVYWHAKQWKPFINSLLIQLNHLNPTIQLLLLGNVAKKIDTSQLIFIKAEHPYNISFITNPIVVQLFKPLDLLKMNK